MVAVSAFGVAWLTALAGFDKAETCAGATSHNLHFYLLRWYAIFCCVTYLSKRKLQYSMERPLAGHRTVLQPRVLTLLVRARPLFIILQCCSPLEHTNHVILFKPPAAFCSMFVTAYHHLT